jgi:hypothetical protein
MKFIFPIYAFPIRDLGHELWIFEVHCEVHKYIGERSRVIGHGSRVTSQELCVSCID